MDRRQQKTRNAIFKAFTSLLATKSYSQISVQDIIDVANVGRSTFYTHFDTKTELLKALCGELFGHVVESAKDFTHHGLYSNDEASKSVFCPLLQHLQENENNVISLLSCESNEIFLRYFKDSLNKLIYSQYAETLQHWNSELPKDFIVNHISSSFVEMVLWWIKGNMRYTPEELDRYFRTAVLEPIIRN